MAPVFAGCGNIIVNDSFTDVLGHVGICLVFGLVVMAIIYSVRNISGAHINAAVTPGFLFSGRLNGRVGRLYIGSQILGSTTLSLSRTRYHSLPAPTVSVVRAMLLSFLLNVSTRHMRKRVSWQEWLSAAPLHWETNDRGINESCSVFGFRHWFRGIQSICTSFGSIY